MPECRPLIEVLSEAPAFHQLCGKRYPPLLRKKIEGCFARPTLFVTPSLPLEPTLRTDHTRDKGQGRTVEWRITASGDAPDGYLDWRHVRPVFRLTRTKTRGGREHTETVHGLTSLSAAQAGPARLLSLVPGHWRIETRSHGVRDVTFDEGRSQVRCDGIPQVITAVRTACIGLMRAVGHKKITPVGPTAHSHGPR